MERWGLKLADGWEAELEEGTVCISHPEGVGALFVSSTEKGSGTVERHELEALARGESPPGADMGDCEFGDFQGVHSSYDDDGVHFHRWYLSYGSLLLLVTSAEDAAEAGARDDDVIGMLRSLHARGDRWE